MLDTMYSMRQKRNWYEFCRDFLMKILSCSHGCYIRSKNYLESCHKWNYAIFKDTIISCNRKFDDRKRNKILKLDTIFFFFQILILTWIFFVKTNDFLIEFDGVLMTKPELTDFSIENLWSCIIFQSGCITIYCCVSNCITGGGE